MAVILYRLQIELQTTFYISCVLVCADNSILQNGQAESSPINALPRLLW